MTMTKASYPLIYRNTLEQVRGHTVIFWEERLQILVLQTLPIQ